MDSPGNIAHAHIVRDFLVILAVDFIVWLSDHPLNVPHCPKEESLSRIWLKEFLINSIKDFGTSTVSSSGSGPISVIGGGAGSPSPLTQWVWPTAIVV